MQPRHPDDGTRRKLDYAAVKQIAGTIEPWQISAILALGATVGDLEQAVTWMAVESDQSGLHHAAEQDLATDSRVAGIYEILATDRADNGD